MTKKLYDLKMILPVIAMISLFSCLIGCVVPEGSKVGNNAPDFTLSTLGSGQFQLSALEGKPVFLSFWTTGCGACIYQMPFLEAAYNEMGDEVEILTIDIMENSYTVQSLMNYYDFSLPVALDSDGTVTEDYNVIYTPTNILIDREGVIQHIKIGAFTSTEQILTIFNDVK